MAGHNYAGTCNQAEEAAADDDVEVEVLSQQMGDLNSPSKPPPPKKHKDGDGGGDGGSSSQAIQLSQ